MRMMAVVLLLVLLSATAALAQAFGPKNYAECVMLNVKRAHSRDAGMLMRRACKCRFQDQANPDCKGYTQGALDCMVANLGIVEQDDEAWGVERACRTKNPAGQ